MNDPTKAPGHREDEPDSGSNSGINLKLIYALLLLGLLAAMAFATLIVLPFYHRR